MTSADVIVVGLGAMGSAALYQLARRGARAIGIDRFSPPHDHGSSGGETRITRAAIGEGEAYVPLVLRSHAIWRELEAETGESLFLACGGLVVSGRRSSHVKKAGFMDTTIAAARHYAIPHEVLGAGELSARYPQLGLEGDERGYFEPGAGLLYPERCIATQLGLAGRLGATIRTDEVVRAVEPDGEGVTVQTDRGRYRAGVAIVAAGAWSPGLVGTSLAGLELYRQVLTWWEPERPADYAPEHFPVFIWMHGAAGAQFYGFPVPPGSAGVKAATETYAAPLPRPEDLDRTVDPEEVRAVYDDHVGGRLRGVKPGAIRAQTCVYTQAPDTGFVVDRHPDAERILLVSACSGHGFKHSAALGEAVAELALDGRSGLDLAPFARRTFAEPASRVGA